MRKLSWCLFLVLLVASLAFVSCARPAPAPKPSPTPAPPPAVTPKPSPAPVVSPKPSPSPVPAPKPAPEIWPKVVRIGCKSAGSATYVMAVAMFKVIEAATGHKANPTPFATSAAFPRDLQDNKVEFAIALNLGPRWAMEGKGAFKDKPTTYLRTIASGSPFQYILGVRPDSGIKKLSDIKGKAIIGNQLGSETVPVGWASLLAAAQLTEKDVTFLPFSGAGAEITAAIREKRAQGEVWYTTPATTYVQELCLTGDLQLISLTDEEIARAIAKEPGFVPTVLPAGTFKGQDKPIKTFGNYIDIITRSTLADEVVYAITAAFHDRFAELVSYCPDFQEYKVPDCVTPSRLALPVHNGAIQYYKERGFWKKAHEDRQAKLLKELKLAK